MQTVFNAFFFVIRNVRVLQSVYNRVSFYDGVTFSNIWL
jgi:hypothetical protein